MPGGETCASEPSLAAALCLPLVWPQAFSPQAGPEGQPHLGRHTGSPRPVHARQPLLPFPPPRMGAQPHLIVQPGRAAGALVQGSWRRQQVAVTDNQPEPGAGGLRSQDPRDGPSHPPGGPQGTHPPLEHPRSEPKGNAWEPKPMTRGPGRMGTTTSHVLNLATPAGTALPHPCCPRLAATHPQPEPGCLGLSPCVSARSLQRYRTRVNTAPSAPTSHKAGVQRKEAAEPGILHAPLINAAVESHPTACGSPSKWARMGWGLGGASARGLQADRRAWLPPGASRLRHAFTSPPWVGPWRQSWRGLGPRTAARGGHASAPA
ncbi:tyrosine-protein phosphatase non-receptor type 23-like [Ursus maritimus]|uniref:Tyrosine-protein phosphatase non-receptor type 23-like n=1 Tax=Ursus maritimus TaxID=29073 RepID=A0A8M1FTA2_URSMA|nr:tyrosine-protein phosphatase non-receptor type 23-like [Ursus maritimus]